MKPFIRVAMPNGATYEIPSSIVAENRAKAMFESHPDEFATLELAMQDTTELFEDSYQLRDWLLNNMNAPEVMPHARMVRFTPPEVDLQFGEWSYHDMPAIIAQLDESTILDMPLEMALSAMSVHGKPCQVAALNDAQGNQQSLIVLIQGGPEITKFYAGGLERLTQSVVATLQTHGQQNTH